MQGLCKGTGQRSELTDSILLTIDTTGLSPEDARPLFFVYILQISKIIFSKLPKLIHSMLSSLTMMDF